MVNFSLLVLLGSEIIIISPFSTLIPDSKLSFALLSNVKLSLSFKVWLVISSETVLNLSKVTFISVVRLNKPEVLSTLYLIFSTGIFNSLEAWFKQSFISFP